MAPSCRHTGQAWLPAAGVLLLPARATFRPRRLVSRTGNGDLNEKFKPWGNCSGLQREVLLSGLLQGSLVPKDDTGSGCSQLTPAPSSINSVLGERVVEDAQKNGEMPAELASGTCLERETELLAPWRTLGGDAGH